MAPVGYCKGQPSPLHARTRSPLPRIERVSPFMGGALVLPEELEVIEQAYDAACPNCGGPARWAGVRTSTYQRMPSARMWLRDSLAFRVDCPVCS